MQWEIPNVFSTVWTSENQEQEQQQEEEVVKNEENGIEH